MERSVPVDQLILLRVHPIILECEITSQMNDLILAQQQCGGLASMLTLQLNSKILLGQASLQQ